MRISHVNVNMEVLESQHCQTMTVLVIEVPVILPNRRHRKQNSISCSTSSSTLGVSHAIRYARHLLTFT